MTLPRMPVSEFRNALPQILAVSVKNLLLMAYGMTIGYPTILIPSLSQQRPGEDIYLNEEEISWIGSINLMCVPIGCFFSGIITQPLGRKRTMQFVSVPFIICWIIFKYSKEPWQIYFALGLTGLSGGLLEAPTVAYGAEVTDPHLRGFLTATSSVSVLLGVLTSFFLGAFLNWRTVAIYSSVGPLAAFVLLFFIPESPHWYMMKNKMEDARKSLAWLRGWTTVQTVAQEIQDLELVNLAQQVNKHQNVESSALEQYSTRQFLYPFLLVGYVFFLSHFSGLTALQTYALKVFVALEVPINEYYATVLFGASQFLGTLICVALVHFAGKRILTLSTSAIAVLCITTIAAYAYVFDLKYFDSNSQRNDIGNYKWIPLMCLLTTACMLECGIRNLPWLLMPEVFARNTRAFGAGVLSAIGCLFGFLTNKVFLQTVSVISLPGTLLCFAGISTVGVIILYFFLPETEGKTLLEITEHFAGRSKLDNKVLTYVAEVTQPHLRGLLAATSTMSIFLGVLVEFFLGAFLHWRTVALYSCIAPACAFAFLFLIPESPHWYIMKNKLQEARKSLAWLRGWTTVHSIEEEFQELSIVRREQFQGAIEEDNLFKQYNKRRFWSPLALVSFVFFLAHFCGITAIQTYAVKIFETLNVPINEYYATILLGFSQFLGCVSCVALVHFVGKRLLTFCTMIVVIICLTATATYSYLTESLYFDPRTEIKDVGSCKWIPLVCLVVAAFMIQSGIRTLPWILVGEVFPRNTRAFGAGLLAGIGYIFGFCTNKIFLQTVSTISLPGTFASFACFTLIGLIVLFFWLPETEGKTLLEITEHFAGKKKLDNTVRRKTQHNEYQGYVNGAFDGKTADFNANGFNDSKM